MALLTPDTGIDVETVVEVDILWESIHSFPGNCLGLIIVLSQLNDRGSSPLCNRMAVHAGACGRDHCISRPVDANVAIGAIDPHNAGVKFVGKGNRLLWCVTYTFPRWPRNKIGDCYGGDCDKDEYWNANPKRVLQLGPVHGYTLTGDIFKFTEGSVWRIDM